MDNESWCTIESDPGLFSELIENIGVTGVQVEEIYSLDQTMNMKSHGLIFLFKWRPETDPRPTLHFSDIPELFFAKQVITNACATQAILSVLLNAEGINLGETLSNFKEFTMEFDADSKGLAISNSDIIRSSHNAFASADPFIAEESKHSNAKGDAYHFVAYIPFNGAVYELDGLKSGPIFLGNISPDSNWWTVARQTIEDRMARYSSAETHFALLTLCESKIVSISSDINGKLAYLSMVNTVLGSDSGYGSVASEDGSFLVGDNKEQATHQKEHLEQELSSLQYELRQEEERIKKQREENARRRHNFVPFVLALVRKLAEKRLLQDLLQKAKDSASRRAADSSTGK